MLVADLGKWLEERGLACRIVTMAPGACLVDLWPKGNPLLGPWSGAASTIEAAVERSQAAFELRDCAGFPEVREVDGTCL